MEQLIGFNTHTYRLMDRIAKSLEKIASLKEKELNLREKELEMKKKGVTGFFE